MSIEKKRKRKNYARRFLSVMLLAVTVNLLLFFIPDSILNVKIKKVDLLSDIRKTPEEQVAAAETEEKAAEEPETDEPETVVAVENTEALVMPDNAMKTPLPPMPPEPKPTPKPTAAPQPPQPPQPQDTIAPTPEAKTPEASEKERSIANYLVSADIEDFTVHHTGLRRFFAALNAVKTLNRPVRIAFMGDSFIEGDIMVSDFRRQMQQHFGGRGVGFIPVSSHVGQFRPTVKQTSEGWKVFSILNDKSNRYVLSGQLFEPSAKVASVDFQTVDAYSGLNEVSSLKIIYAANRQADVVLKYKSDALVYELPPSTNVKQFEFKGVFTKGALQFKNTVGLKMLGLALEDNKGVVVDNFSLRGNSGPVMSRLDVAACRQLQRIRPYDLIVLQYGLNVLRDSILNYNWYRQKMLSMIVHIQTCFPGADILLLGVSDHCHKTGNTYSTSPAVLSLLKTQWQTAKEARVTFWSIYAAMGGRNSMVKYVDANWASKDYTHLRFRGGKEIANALYKALLKEKEMYDGDEKLVERQEVKYVE